MSATVTVTGTAGPGLTVTAEEFTGVLSFSQDCVNNILELNLDTGRTLQISITAAVTYTVTKSDSTYTVTIANA